MTSNDKFNGLHIAVSTDISQLRKGIKDATSDLKDFENIGKQISQRIKNNPLEVNIDDSYDEQFENLKKQIKEVQLVYDEMNKKKLKWDTDGVDKQSAAYQLLAKTVNELHNKREKLLKQEETYQKQVKISNAYINKFKVLYDNTSTSLKQCEQRYREIDNALKSSPNNLELYSKKQEVVAEAVDKTRKRLEELELVQKNLDSDASKGYVVKDSEEYKKLQNEIVLCKDKLKNYEEVQKQLPKDIEKLNEELNKTPTFFNEFNEQLKQTSKQLDLIVQSTEGLSKAMTALTVFDFKNAINYESEVAKIKKVIQDLSDETVQSLKDIAVETGNEFNNISDVASLGATLGIAQEDIASFTKTMIDLNTATDGAISTTDGSKSVARFLNVMGIGTEYAENFGSALTYVGDQFAATADEVLEVSNRMAGLSTIIGANQYDLIGLAAEMKNLGLSSESSSSAMTRVFMTINNAVATGDDTLEEFAEVSNMTVEQFKKAWGDDAVDTFLYFVDGLDTSLINEISDAIENNTSKVEEYASTMGMTKERFIELFNSDQAELIDLYADSLEDLSDESESASVILDDLSLTNVRTAETLLKLAGNGEVVRGAIKDASKAWEENTALTDKANTVYETVESRYKALYEKLKQVGASFAEDWLPTLETLINAGTDILSLINKMNPKAKNLITLLTLGTAGATKTAKGISTLSKKFTTLNDAIGEIGNNSTAVANGGIAKLCKSIVDKGGLTTILSSALPAAATAAGVGLIALAGYMAVATSDTEKFKKTIESLDDTASQSYLNDLKDIDIQFRNVPSIIDKITELQSNLTFDKNGNVITTTDAYKEFVSAIEDYNDVMGYEAINIDDINTLLQTQNGLVDALNDTYRERRLEAQRDAYLKDYEEKYKEAVSTANQYSQILVDKETELDGVRKTFLDKHKEYTDEDLAVYEKIATGAISQTDYIKQYIEQNYDEVKRYADETGTSIDEAASKISEQLNEKFNQLGTDLNAETNIVSLLQEYQVANDIYQKAMEIVQAYNAVDTASLEELPTLLEELTGTTYDIVIDYDKESLESVNGAIDSVKEKIQSCDRLAQEGIDTSKYREALVEQWKSLETERQNLEKNLESTEEFVNVVGGTIGDIFGSNGSLKQKVDEGAEAVQASIQTPFMNAFNSIDAYQLQSKSMTVYVDYVTRSQASNSVFGTKKGKNSGGYFGDLISKIPTRNISPLIDSIGKTIGNARQVQAKYASGGYSNQISLNASFSINNVGKPVTQTIAKQMAKQISDLVNEELGKAI